MAQSNRTDNLVGNTGIKRAVIAATTANITLSGEQTIDGIAIVDGDRVLVKDQTDGIENGIYIANTGTWTRAPDWDGSYDVTEGTIVTISRGTVNASSAKRVTNTSTPTVGTDAITFGNALYNTADGVSFTQAGTGAVERTSQSKMRERVSVFDFGAVGDGVTDETAAVLAASVAAVAAGTPVSFAGGTFLLGSVIALTSAHSGLTWQLDGGTIKKGFNGDLVTINGTTKFSVMGPGTIDGVQASYTGRGFVFSGGSNYPVFSPGVFMYNFPDAAIEFGADAGFRARIDHVIFRNDTTDVCSIRVAGTDTTAMDRNFTGLGANGWIELTDALGTQVIGCYNTGVRIGSGCFPTSVMGGSWALSTGITIDGATTFISGVRISNSVTLSATMTGAYYGNEQTAGTFTNNAGSGVWVENLGRIFLQSGTAALPAMTFALDQDTGLWHRGTNVVTVSVNGVDRWEFQSADLLIGKDMAFSWGNGTTISNTSAIDTGLQRNAAGIVEVNNGTAGALGSLAAKIQPATDAGAAQTAATIYAGSGAPDNGNGINGDFYLRSDGTAGGNTVIYHKEAGSWVALTTT